MSVTGYTKTKMDALLATINTAISNAQASASSAASQAMTAAASAASALSAAQSAVAALAAKAPLASPAFTGTPTIAGVAVATTSSVQTAVGQLVNSAPATLDTLGELASALNAGNSASAALTASLATKAPLDSPAFTGTPTVNGAALGSGSGGSATTDASQLSTGTLPAARIGAGAITTARVADGAITAVKVAADVATQAELDALAGSVSSSLSTKVNSSTYVAGLNGKQNVLQVFSTEAAALAGVADGDIVLQDTTGAASAIVGDGVTDVTAAIQALIDAAATVGGGTVRLLQGTYVITQLVYRSDVTLEGAGEQTVLTLKSGLGTSAHIMLRPADTSVNGAVIRNLTLDHRSDLYPNVTTAPTVSVDGTARTLIENVTFTRVQTMAVWADSSASAPTAGLIVRYCRQTSGISGGISFFGNVTDFQLVGNTIEGTMDDAIACQEGGNANVGQVPQRGVISGNLIRNADQRNSINATPNGINIFGARSIAVTGNTVTRTVSNGILVTAGTTVRALDVTVMGNVVTNAGRTTASTTGVPGNGIRVNAADDVTIVGNTVTGSRGNGIDATSATGVVVSGNKVRSSDYAGVSLVYSYNVTVSGNVIRDNGAVGNQFGIALISDGVSPQDTQHVSITGNRATDTRSGGARTQQYGVFVAGSWTDYVSIVGNSLEGNTVAGIGGATPAHASIANNLTS